MINVSMINVSIVEVIDGIGDGKWRVWLMQGDKIINLGKGMNRAEAIKTARISLEKIAKELLNRE